MNKDEIFQLAALINGEGADQPDDVKTMIGSTVLNRLESGRVKEFGASIPEIIQKGYYAAINKNKPYTQALTQTFPDKVSQGAYNRALQIAYGLANGTIERTKGEFFHTPSEIKKQKAAKAFNYDAVKNVGEIGPYKVFSYA